MNKVYGRKIRAVIGAAIIGSGIGGASLTAFTQTAAAGVPQECEELPGMNATIPGYTGDDPCGYPEIPTTTTTTTTTTTPPTTTSTTTTTTTIPEEKECLTCDIVREVFKENDEDMDRTLDQLVRDWDATREEIERFIEKENCFPYEPPMTTTTTQAPTTTTTTTPSTTTSTTTTTVPETTTTTQAPSTTTSTVAPPVVPPTTPNPPQPKGPGLAYTGSPFTQGLIRFGASMLITGAAFVGLSRSKRIKELLNKGAEKQGLAGTISARLKAFAQHVESSTKGKTFGGFGILALVGDSKSSVKSGALKDKVKVHFKEGHTPLAEFTPGANVPSNIVRREQKEVSIDHVLTNPDDAIANALHNLFGSPNGKTPVRMDIVNGQLVRVGSQKQAPSFTR